MTFGTVQIVSVTIVHNRFLGSRFHSKDFAPMRYSVSQLPSTKNVQNELRWRIGSKPQAWEGQRRSHNFRCLACIKKFATESCAVRAQCEPHVPVRVQSHHRSIHIYPSRALHHRLPRLALHEATVIGDSEHHQGQVPRHHKCTLREPPRVHSYAKHALAGSRRGALAYTSSISGVMASRQHIFAAW